MKLEEVYFEVEAYPAYKVPVVYKPGYVKPHLAYDEIKAQKIITAWYCAKLEVGVILVRFFSPQRWDFVRRL